MSDWHQVLQKFTTRLVRILPPLAAFAAFELLIFVALVWVMRGNENLAQTTTYTIVYAVLAVLLLLVLLVGQPVTRLPRPQAELNCQIYQKLDAWKESRFQGDEFIRVLRQLVRERAFDVLARAIMRSEYELRRKAW